MDYSKVVLEASSEPEHHNSSDSDFHEVVYSRYHRASQEKPAKSDEGDSIGLIEANLEQEEEEEVPCNQAAQMQVFLQHHSSSDSVAVSHPSFESAAEEQEENLDVKEEQRQESEDLKAKVHDLEGKMDDATKKIASLESQVKELLELK